MRKHRQNSNPAFPVKVSPAYGISCDGSTVFGFSTDQCREVATRTIRASETEVYFYCDKHYAVARAMECDLNLRKKGMTEVYREMFGEQQTNARIGTRPDNPESVNDAS